MLLRKITRILQAGNPERISEGDVEGPGTRGGGRRLPESWAGGSPCSVHVARFYLHLNTPTQQPGSTPRK